MSATVEIRTFALEADPGDPGAIADHGQIKGYAAVFDSLSEPIPMSDVALGGKGTFREKIEPGAFQKSLARGDNIRALYEHQDDLELGNTDTGTLRLREDGHGLYIELDLPGNAWAQRIREDMKAGKVTQASFGFRVLSDEWEDSLTRGKIRTLKRVYLSEVTITGNPAYPATKLEARTEARTTETMERGKKEMGKDMITISKKELDERLATAAQTAQVERSLKGMPDTITAEMENRAKAEYFKSKAKSTQISQESRNLLGIDHVSYVLPRNMAESVILDYPEANPLREVMTVTSVKNLEQPILSYVSPEGAEELELTGGSVEFDLVRFRPKARIMDSVLLGSSSYMAETIEAALSSIVLANERQRIFANDPSDHMSLYQKGIKEVTGNNKYEAVEAALADLPQAIRNVASVALSFDDYKEIVKHLATIGLGALASNRDDVFNRKLIIIDEAIHPVVGDFQCLHANYHEMFLDTDKEVGQGTYIFVMPTFYDIRVTIPEAFRVVKVATDEE